MVVLTLLPKIDILRLTKRHHKKELPQSLLISLLHLTSYLMQSRKSMPTSRSTLHNFASMCAQVLPENSYSLRIGTKILRVIRVRSATVLGKVLFRYIYVHMKRLDLHPITYGIPSLQHTMNGRLASPRYSRGHSQIPHGMVQYVQIQQQSAFWGGSGTFVSQSPSPCPLRPCLLEMKSCSRQYILII